MEWEGEGMVRHVRIRGLVGPGDGWMGRLWAGEASVRSPLPFRATALPPPLTEGPRSGREGPIRTWHRGNP